MNHLFVAAGGLLAAFLLSAVMTLLACAIRASFAAPGSLKLTYVERDPYEARGGLAIVLAFMDRAGAHPFPAAIAQRSNESANGGWISLLPTSCGLGKTERALHEHLGLAALAAGVDQWRAFWSPGPRVLMDVHFSDILARSYFMV